MTTYKKSTSFRLSEEALASLKEISERKHLSQAQVVEVALREMAASTPEQKDAILEARKRAFDRLIIRDGVPKTKKDAWILYRSAHNTGFYHYQFRHAVTEYEDIKDGNPDNYRSSVSKVYMKGVK
jgi:hypothetical protein